MLRYRARFVSLPTMAAVLLNLFLISTAVAHAAPPKQPEPQPKFRVVAIAEAGGIHKPFVDAAKIWLNKLAAQSNFTVDYIQDTGKIDDAFLAHYQLFIQLNYPPYNWTPTAAAAEVRKMGRKRRTPASSAACSSGTPFLIFS